MVPWCASAMMVNLESTSMGSQDGAARSCGDVAPPLPLPLGMGRRWAAERNPIGVVVGVDGCGAACSRGTCRFAQVGLDNNGG